MGWAIQKRHKISFVVKYRNYMPSMVGVPQEGLSIVIAAAWAMVIAMAEVHATAAECAAIATTQQAAAVATAARALAASAAAFNVHRHSVQGP